MLTFRPIESSMSAITFSVRTGHLLVEEYFIAVRNDLVAVEGKRFDVEGS